MTTVLSLRHVILVFVTLAVFGAAALLGLPRWLAALAAGLACAAALALPRLIARLRAAPGVDRHELSRALTRSLRLFAADRELGERAVHLVVGCPGADVAALLAGAGFAPEPLPASNGPPWTAWRRRASLLLEIPAACLEVSADAAWQAALDVLPRRLLRRWTRGALVVARWHALEAADAASSTHAAELVRNRLRALARHLGLDLPAHLVVVSGGEPALAPLLAAPLRVDRARAWGFRLPHHTDPAVCEAAVADEFAALAASFASRVVEGLGDPEHVQVDMSGEAPRAHQLLPLIPRVQRLRLPLSRLVADLLAGGPRLHTIWPRGVWLASDAPPAFTSELFTAALAADAALVRPNAAARAARRLRLAAAALALAAGLLAVGLLALRAYRANQRALADIRVAAAGLPVTLGPTALTPIATLRALLDRVADMSAWPGPFAGLATASQLRVPLHGVYTTAVHESLYRPTLDRARARLCPARSAPLTDDEVADLQALLDLYTLGTWAELPGKQNPRTLAEREVEDDAERRATVVRDGAAAAWSRDTGVAESVRERIAELLVAHLPVVLQNKRLHPRREDACVRQAQQRLQAWRDRACTVEALPALVPGQHTLRGLLQSPHADALADTDELTIAAVHTAAGLAELSRRYADPTLRCGRGGFAFGVRRDEDRRGAEANRRALFEAHAAAHVHAWETLLAALRPAARPRGCPDLGILLHRLAASEGPLRKLPALVARVALPPPAPAGPTPWHEPHDAAIRAALAPYADVGRAPEGEKPPIDGLLVGLGKLRALVEPGAATDRNEATLRFAEVKTHVENACSLIDPRGADLLRALVKPVLDHGFQCIDGGGGNLADPWCAEVAGPFARVLGGTYPFDPDARRDAQLPDLCQFYCPQKGAAWRYYEEHLAAVLFTAGNGRFTPNLAPGFVSFRSYNPALAPFYGRTWRLSNLLFPFGDTAEPALALRVYAPPIDLPGVEVEEIRLELDGQTILFTNARERWRDLAWPGAGARSRSGALLRVRGRYHGEPFSEELQDRGAWALFRLLERASEAAWTGDHLRFRFTFAALHGLGVDLEIDAGIANELFLDRDTGKPMSAFRASAVTPPRSSRRNGPVCPL